MTVKDLIAWQKGMDLVVSCYKYIDDFPREEMYGLSSQIKRASVSIVANIAEGHSRDSSKQFSHFLNIAQGSCSEVETLLLIGERLSLGNQEKRQAALRLKEDVGRLLNNLKKAIDSK